MPSQPDTTIWLGDVNWSGSDQDKVSPNSHPSSIPPLSAWPALTCTRRAVRERDRLRLGDKRDAGMRRAAGNYASLKEKSINLKMAKEAELQANFAAALAGRGQKDK